MSFIKAYLHKEYRTKKKRWQHLVRCHRLGYSPWNATIPGGLLSSRARFRLMAKASKLDPNLYINNLSEKWGGHTGKILNPRAYKCCFGEKLQKKAEWLIGPLFCFEWQDGP